MIYGQRSVGRNLGSLCELVMPCGVPRGEVRYDRIIPGVHISVLCTRDSIRSLHVWKRFTLPIPSTIHPILLHLHFPRHPGSGLNRHGLITFPGGSLLPPLASHSSGQLGPANRPFAPSLSVGFHTFHLAGHHP